MRVRLLLAAAAALTTTVLVACGSPGAQDDTPQDDEPADELTVLVSASPSATGLRELATEYTAETGVTIEFVEVPTAQLPTKIILAVQSGQQTFDLAQFDGFTMPQIAAASALLPLDDFLGEDDEYDYADFPEGLQEYAKQDGTTYGLPLSTEPVVQLYRTDLYQQLGLQPATTWDEVVGNADALSAAGHYGWASAYGPAVSAHYYNQMLYSSGGRLLDPESYEPQFDTDINRQVMERFLSLVEYTPESSRTGASADMINAFSQLQVGQLTAASGWYSTVADPSQSAVAETFGVADLPMESGGPYDSINVLNGWLLGISPSSPHQQAAWDFAAWALGKDNVKAFIDAGAPPPARTSTTTNDDYTTQLPYLTAVGTAAETGAPIERIPETAQIISVISQTINSMATGQLSLDEGMAKIQDDLTNILVQAGRYGG
ncbi:ABC transporter substrate-binding protein [Jiangella endophytica]|uniref:ABC transporter substrate-binding protein n=1 Tax=Jiangella endophytica TaxID=1623398 RepID=UPI000E347C9E|nr:sugar ABC transporter substrate-binding protein [Jiangella endophytica]